MAGKRVVHYDPAMEPCKIKVGAQAEIVPIDHASVFVRNGRKAITTPVLSYNEKTGEFYTLNSHYKPKPMPQNVIDLAAAKEKQNG